MTRERTNASEEFRRELKAKLSHVQQEAEELSVADERELHENQVLEGFLSGKLSLKEYHEQDPRGDKLFPGEVEMATIGASHH